jgi:hypothetical protein
MVHRTLTQYLSPMLGEATAVNLLKHYCVRMKINPEDITATDLPDLATSMRPMLAVWLGSAGAARVSEEIAQMGRGAAVK